MRFLFLSVLMIGVGVGMVGCEDDDGGAPEPEEEQVEESDGDVSRGPQEHDLDFHGTIQVLIPDAGEGGGSELYLILGEDGTVYDPGGTLPEAFRVSGLRVRVFAVDVGETSVLGRVINIVEIRVRAD